MIKSLICSPLATLLAVGSVNGATVLTNHAVFGFTDLLSYRNATSKGWNFGNSAANAPATTLLGVPLHSNLGATDVTNGLSFTTAPLTYAIGGFA